MNTKTQSGLTRVLSLTLAVALSSLSIGCGDNNTPVPVAGPMFGEMPETPTATQCGNLQVELPAEGALLQQPNVLVKGTVTGSAETMVYVNGLDVQPIDGLFEVVLDLQDGSHAIEITCDAERATRNITVSTQQPRVIIEAPASGSLVQQHGGTVPVQGRIEHPAGVRSVQLNGRNLNLDAMGRFTANHTPTPGMNHLDVVVTTVAGELVDARRSFLYGQFTDWNDTQSAAIVADLRTTALEEVARVLETRLTAAELQNLMMSDADRIGNVEIHELAYERIELDVTPLNGQFNLRLRLHDFGVDLTYHYNIAGIGGRIRGWARSRPIDVEATVIVRKTADGGYDISLQNPSVELSNFELELNDFYAAVEDLVRPLVRDMARDAMLDALRSVFVEDLLGDDLLRQDIEVFGQEMKLKMDVDTLQITPEGIHGVSHARLDPMNVVHQAPGFWTSRPTVQGHNGRDDIALGMSVDVFNRIFGEAWRGGLFDLDLLTVLGGGSPMTVGVLAGVVGPQLTQYFPANAIVHLDSTALMQPVTQIVNPASGQIKVSIGALQVRVSSENMQGQRMHWATLEVAADFTVQPRFDRGEFTVDVDLDTQVELVGTPLFPIAESGLESFLETLVDGASAQTINELVDDAFSFGELNLLGIGIGHVSYGSTSADPGFLMLGIDLAEVQAQ